MRIAFTILVCLALLPSAAAAQGPEIDVVDGKISISAQAVPLGRLMSLLDRTMGFTSQVKPELANRNISVRFTGLDIKNAVHKIFEGQPLNYMFIEGKGIRVTDLAQGGGAATSSSTFSSSTNPSPFTDSQSTIGNPPFQGGPTIQPANAAQPVNAATQPAQVITPLGGQPNPNPANTSSNPNAPTPGQLPPVPGANNPNATPAAAGPFGGGGFPGGAPATAPAPPQPSGPGTLPGATPGVTR